MYLDFLQKNFLQKFQLWKETFFKRLRNFFFFESEETI